MIASSVVIVALPSLQITPTQRAASAFSAGAYDLQFPFSNVTLVANTTFAAPLAPLLPDSPTTFPRDIHSSSAENLYSRLPVAVFTLNSGFGPGLPSLPVTGQSVLMPSMYQYLLPSLSTSPIVTLLPCTIVKVSSVTALPFPSSTGNTHV